MKSLSTDFYHKLPVVVFVLEPLKSVRLTWKKSSLIQRRKNIQEHGNRIKEICHENGAQLFCAINQIIYTSAKSLSRVYKI